METHIFDVDHTIVRCSTVREFIFEGLKEGAIPLSIGFYAVYFFLIYNLWGPRQAHFERQYPFFRNISETTLEKLSEATFARRIRPRLDRAIALRIASILSESGRVMLASRRCDDGPFVERTRIPTRQERPRRPVSRRAGPEPRRLRVL